MSGLNQRVALDFSLVVACGGIDPPLRVRFTFDQMLPEPDAVTHVRVIAVSPPERRVIDGTCTVVRQYVATLLRGIDIGTQSGNRVTFGFLGAVWNDPLDRDDEVIIFLSPFGRDRWYYDFGAEYRIPILPRRNMRY